MKIYNGEDLVSVKMLTKPCSLTIYNLNTLDISNISIHFLKYSNDFSVLALTSRTSIAQTESSAQFYFLPLSNTLKSIECDIVLTFTIAKELNFLQIHTSLQFYDGEVLLKILHDIQPFLGWGMMDFTMNLMQYSILPCDQVFEQSNIKLKYWCHILMYFDTNTHKAVVFGPATMLNNLSIVISRDFGDNCERFTQYFALGRELTLSLDYILLNNRIELKNSLVKMNWLLEKLGIEFKFTITESSINAMQPTDIEMVQNQIMLTNI